MRPTVLLRSGPLGYTGTAGVGFANVKPKYETYKSPYGPSYKIQPNIRGISPGRAIYFALSAGAFGVVAAVAGLQFLSDVPKVKKDIVEKIPIVGDIVHKEVPSSDNPF